MQMLRIWSVGDVGSWLNGLPLTQYKSDGAGDGLLLLHLGDVELKNVLGMERSLH